MTDRSWRPTRHARSAGSSRPARTRYWAAAAVLVLLAGCTPPGLPAAIAPGAGSAAAGSQVGESAITIGVDGTVEGFNPHAIADYSLADSAVAELVLPSVSSLAADGSVRLNADVVQKAEVTSNKPFTVTYTLDRDAAWSDGTPITAEDFSYLRDEMLIEPGTVDPAGYRLITAIVSRDAGKTVQVVFDHAVPDWQTLFSPLLPSHILKDAPGGWVEGLATGIPVSGNRYKMQSYNSVTGEITLVRNDKYWGAQPGPSTAVLRIGTPAALIAALGRGDLQAVWLQPGAADQRSLEATVPAARRVAIPLPGTVQLVFDTTSGVTAMPEVRRALALGLDLNAIRSVLDGGNPGGGSVASWMFGPGTDSADPGTDDPSAALADLAAVGYSRRSLYMSKNGQILRLRLTYSSLDPRLAAAAALIQSQLAVIGVEIDLVRDDPRGVVNQRLALGAVDLGLVLVPRGAADVLAAGSEFGCPLQPTARTGDSTRVALPRAGNLSGFCSTQVQALVDQAAIVGMAPGELNPLLSAALPVLPLSRPSTVFATSAGLAPVLSAQGPGWVYSGPLSGLPNWPSS